MKRCIRRQHLSVLLNAYPTALGFLNPFKILSKPKLTLVVIDSSTRCSFSCHSCRLSYHSLCWCPNSKTLSPSISSTTIWRHGCNKRVKWKIPRFYSHRWRKAFTIYSMSHHTSTRISSKIILYKALKAIFCLATLLIKSSKMPRCSR